MLSEALQLGSPATLDSRNWLSALDRQSEVRTTCQPIELRRPEGKGLRMHGPKRGEKMDGSDGRVVARSVRSDETDPGQERVGILSVAG